MLTLSLARSMHRLQDGRVIFQEPKTAKSRRMIALTPSSAQVLRQRYHLQATEAALLGVSLGDNAQVFSQPDGLPLAPDAVSHAFAKIARRAGLKGVRLHDMRHTHASLMLQQGIHPKIVSERLGHASIQITLDTYSHVLPGLQEAAALRFDEALVPGEVADTSVSIVG